MSSMHLKCIFDHWISWIIFKKNFQLRRPSPLFLSIKIFNFFILLDVFFLVFLTFVKTSKYLWVKNRQIFFCNWERSHFFKKKSSFECKKKKLERPHLRVFGRIIHKNLSKFTKLKGGLGRPRWRPLFIDNTKWWKTHFLILTGESCFSSKTNHRKYVRFLEKVTTFCKEMPASL